ncbi:acyltransferase [Erwiniaceae bacterium L1_54_6]|nr:acyltransferase [Erwiniaceae bacterium L1_54_6]
MEKKKFKLIYIFSAIKVIFLKIKYGSKLKLDITKVFIHPGASLNIKDNGSITINTDAGRVYLSKGSSVIASGGVLEIGSGVFFNVNNHIVCHKKITIGADCMFGHNVCIFDSDHQYKDPIKNINNQGYITQETYISPNVWVGAGTIITKGTFIGNHVVIGANSVVRGTLDNVSLYAGNPVRFLRKIYEK